MNSLLKLNLLTCWQRKALYCRSLLFQVSGELKIPRAHYQGVTRLFSVQNLGVIGFYFILFNCRLGISEIAFTRSTIVLVRSKLFHF